MQLTNAKKNVIYAVIFQLISLFSGFIIRKLLVDNIGIYLIGVNGVYENIISMLCLFNFGIGPASFYFLYLSFSHKDYENAAKYYQAFNKLFRYVAIAVGLIGAILIINIGWIVNTNNGNTAFLRLFFFIHLLKAISSFLITVPRYVLQCDEKRYYSLLADTVCLIVFALIKGYCLIKYQSFVQYLLLSILETFCANGYVYLCLRKEYKDKGFFVKKDIKKETGEILAYSKHLAINNINAFINNCTDNIVLSKICGEVIVGYMSNYYLIVNAIVGLTSQIFSSLEATFIKQFDLAGSVEEEKKIYRSEMCFSYIISSFVSIFLYALTDAFIKFYFGEEFYLSNTITLLMTISLALTIFQYPSAHYLAAKGMNNLLVKASTLMVISNISLSVILSLLIGEKGVLFGTIIANMILLIGQDLVAWRHSDMYDSGIVFEKIWQALLCGLQFILVFLILPKEHSFYSLVVTFFKCLLIWALFMLPYLKKIMGLAKELIRK